MTTHLTPRLLKEGTAVMPLVAVQEFMQIGGQTVHGFNGRQAALYIGLLAEELAEALKAVAEASILNERATALQVMVADVQMISEQFKGGHFDAEVGAVNRADLLDAAIDSSWVSIGLALSVAKDLQGVVGAFREVTRANFDKYPDGVAIHDEQGKIRKPQGWRGPDHTNFVFEG